MSDASVPGDIERRDLTDEQVNFLLMSFGGEASDKGLVATFIKRAQEDGLTTLVIHFNRATAAIPGPVPVAQADAAAAGQPHAAAAAASAAFGAAVGATAVGPVGAAVGAAVGAKAGPALKAAIIGGTGPTTSQTKAKEATAPVAAAHAGPYVAARPEKWLGEAVPDGQCVAYVRLASGAPHTSQWERGPQVEGNNAVLKGTAIATFDPDGLYGNHTDGRSHAAIYLSQNSFGLTVLDQWVGQVVHRRLIRFAPPGAQPVNDGTKFYVVG